MLYYKSTSYQTVEIDPDEGGNENVVPNGMASDHEASQPKSPQCSLHPFSILACYFTLVGHLLLYSGSAMEAVSLATSPADEAWLVARQLFERDCGHKATEQIISQSVEPKDLLSYIKQRRQEQSRSESSILLNKVSTFGASFERYHSAMDVMAQAGGWPGCLLWGSIRVVLSVSKPSFPAPSKGTWTPWSSAYCD